MIDSLNPLILLLHVTLICGLTLLALRLGKETMVAWLGVLAIAMNLFTLKQTTLFGLHVTCSDALAVGYLLSLNLIQEFFGSPLAKKALWISIFLSLGFIGLSQLHLAYLPNAFDTTQHHFISLLLPMPRLLLASLISFFVVQLFDLSLFAFLRLKSQGRFFAWRALCALFLSQVLDTILFSFLGLYGIVESITDCIFFSLLIKIIVIIISSPFIFLSKKIINSFEKV